MQAISWDISKFNTVSNGVAFSDLRRTILSFNLIYIEDNPIIFLNAASNDLLRDDNQQYLLIT